MPDSLPNLLQFDSLRAANSILLLGFILFLGTVGGFIFKKLRIPQVVGYIVIGILIGQSGSRLLSSQVLTTLEPVSSFALSLIGFLIGAELKITVIRKYGKQFTGILLLESIVPFFIVSILVSAVAFLATGDLPRSVSLGLLLGAISSATAPAATTDVLAENRTKGPLTTILLGIVAMDDAVALVLFSIASTVAAGLLGQKSAGLGTQLLSVAYSIGVSSAVGGLAGYLLALIIKHTRNDDGRSLAFALGAIMLLTGISSYFGLDTILAAMAMGFFIVNFAPFKSADLFLLVDKFTPPVYVMFFVLVGAKLNIWNVSAFFGLVALVYVVGRTVGKSVGSTIGARITRAPATVRKYMKWCLLSQAGVAIGLSISAGQLFPDTVGPTVILVVTATTFIVQLIGPLSVRHGVTKAGECGLDVTEEDILREGTVADVIASQRKVTALSEDATFSKVLDAFGRQTALSCPVITPDKKLAGVISIENIKEALLLGEIAEGLLACDVMDPTPLSCSPGDGIDTVKELLRLHHADTIPVVDSDGGVKGIVEARGIELYFHKKVLELQKKAVDLESV